MRGASGAVVGLILALGYVATSDSLAVAHRVWAAVIAFSTLLAVCVYVGTSRHEHNKTRAQLELWAAAVREELRSTPAADNSRRIDELTGALMDLTATTREAMDRATRQRENIDEGLGDLVELVHRLAIITAGIAEKVKDPADQEAEWYMEAVNLGKELEREDARRRGGETRT
jgi:hypothetical protein